jgi:hypothetical protein
VKFSEPHQQTAWSPEVEIGPVDITKRTLKFYAAEFVLKTARYEGILWQGRGMGVNQA